LDWILKYW